MGQSCLDVVRCKRWIRLENLLFRHTVGKILDDESHPDTCTADARLTEAYVRIDRDALQQTFALDDTDVARLFELAGEKAPLPPTEAP